MKNPRHALPLPICKLRTCGKAFTPDRKWQVFCTNDCHDEYWRLMRPVDAMMDQYLRERLGHTWLDDFWQWRQQR